VLQRELALLQPADHRLETLDDLGVPFLRLRFLRHLVRPLERPCTRARMALATPAPDQDPGRHGAPRSPPPPGERGAASNAYSGSPDPAGGETDLPVTSTLSDSQSPRSTAPRGASRSWRASPTSTSEAARTSAPSRA